MSMPMRARTRAALLALFAASAPARGQPAADTLPRVDVSLAERRLWVTSPGGDTLFHAPVAVGSGRVLRQDGREWRFQTPRGASVVAAKQVAPLWVPPDWHYIEVARARGWKVAPLGRADTVPLSDARRLVVQDDMAGVLDSLSHFTALPADEEIVFGSVLYIPPFGTRNRAVAGVLGSYRLLLANGVGLHGTNVPESIGKAVTHGCIRLANADITWLYENIPLGARVVIR